MEAVQPREATTASPSTPAASIDRKPWRSSPGAVSRTQVARNFTSPRRGRPGFHAPTVRRADGQSRAAGSALSTRKAPSSSRGKSCVPQRNAQAVSAERSARAARGARPASAKTPPAHAPPGPTGAAAAPSSSPTTPSRPGAHRRRVSPRPTRPGGAPPGASAGGPPPMLPPAGLWEPLLDSRGGRSASVSGGGA